MLAPVAVPCVNGHHESHTVYLAPALDLQGGIAAEQVFLAWLRSVPKDMDLDKGIRDPRYQGFRDQLTRDWLPIFVRHGVKDWDVCDEAGEPAPFDIEAVLGDYRLARPVADQAADLYQEAVLSPFRPAQPARSPTSPTRATTSRRRTRTPKPSE